MQHPSPAYDPSHVAAYYVAIFAPRTDVYSAWTPEGWRPVREPLTADVAIAGLSGQGPSISAYMIAPDSVSHVLAYDFDTDDGLQQALHRLAPTLHGHDITCYVETSRRGAHVWCLLDTPVQARWLRMAAKGLLQAAGLPSDDPHIEIRPGSDTIDAHWHEHVSGAVVGTGLGHALRMPLMPHPKTGQRGKLLYQGEPLRGTLAEMLLAIDQNPSERITAWAERYIRPPLEKLPPTYKNQREKRGDDGASASEILRTQWGALDAVPGRVFSCPATEYHAHGDVHKGCRVFPDDRRVMCHKPGCILNNDGRGRGTYELQKLAPRG